MFEVMENLGLQYLNNLYKEYTTLSVYCVSATDTISGTLLETSRWPIGIVQVFQNMFEVLENYFSISIIYTRSIPHYQFIVTKPISGTH